jgi:hypothetical protein
LSEAEYFVSFLSGFSTVALYMQMSLCLI